MSGGRDRGRLRTAMAWVGGLGGPVGLTAILSQAPGHERSYVFAYLALVATLSLTSGLWVGLVAAGLSFLLVDYFFVPPIGTFTISDEQDLVNLAAFLVIAIGVGLLGSRRRQGQLQAEALSSRLGEANAELVRLNKAQAESALAELRLARSEQSIRSLQEIDQLRRELLANVSHELRTPLATILAESTSGRGPDSLTTIATEARRLESLVKDMLDMARIEGGAVELDLEPVDLGEALDAAAERLHRSSPGRRVERQPGGERLDVLADWERLGQILDNLLGNADRFAPEGSPLQVEAEAGAGGLATVRVCDQGPGVAPDLRDHVFERFVRGKADLDGTVRAGSGLGLAIVKGLVEAHAGRVWLADQASGTQVCFTLPLAGPQP